MSTTATPKDPGGTKVASAAAETTVTPRQPTNSNKKKVKNEKTNTTSTVTPRKKATARGGGTKKPSQPTDSSRASNGVTNSNENAVASPAAKPTTDADGEDDYADDTVRSEDEIEEEETLRRFISSTNTTTTTTSPKDTKDAKSTSPSKRAAPVWSFHPSQKDWSIEGELGGSGELDGSQTSEIPENFDQFSSVDVEARAMLAASTTARTNSASNARGGVLKSSHSSFVQDHDAAPTDDWSSFSPDDLTPRSMAKKAKLQANQQKTEESKSEPSSDPAPITVAPVVDLPPPSVDSSSSAKSPPANSKTKPSPYPPPNQNQTPRLPLKPPTDAPGVASPKTAPSKLKPPSLRAAVTVVSASVHTTPKKTNRKLSVEPTSPASPPLAATSGGWTANSPPVAAATATDAPSSPVPKPQPPSLLKTPSISNSSSSAATMLAQLQQQLESAQHALQQTTNQLTAKNLRLKSVTKEKDALAQELTQAKAELTSERERFQKYVQTQRGQSAQPITPMTAANGTLLPPGSSGASSGGGSLQAHQHKSHLQQKRLKGVEEELAAAKTTINKLTLSLDSMRRRLRVKMAKDLPPGVLRTLTSQRMQIEELRAEVQKNAGGPQTNFKALLEVQHTIDEQNSLIDSLQTELQALTKEKQQLIHDLGQGALLQSESKFVDATPVVAVSPHQITHIRPSVSIPNKRLNEEDVDPLGDDTAPNSPQSGSDPNAAVRQILARARIHSVDSQPASGSLSPRAVVANTTAPTPYVAQSTQPTSPYSVPTIPLDQHQLEMGQLKATIQSLTTDLELQRSLVQQYNQRHQTSDRLAKSQYAQLCVLTKEYHTRGEIMHNLTVKLRTALDEIDWLKREGQEMTEEHKKQVEDLAKQYTEQIDQLQQWKDQHSQQQMPTMPIPAQSAAVHIPVHPSSQPLHRIEERKESLQPPMPILPPSQPEKLHVVHKPAQQPAPTTTPQLPILSQAALTPTIASILTPVQQPTNVANSTPNGVSAGRIAPAVPSPSPPMASAPVNTLKPSVRSVQPIQPPPTVQLHVSPGNTGTPIRGASVVHPSLPPPRVSQLLLASLGQQQRSSSTSSSSSATNHSLPLTTPTRPTTNSANPFPIQQSSPTVLNQSSSNLPSSRVPHTAFIATNHAQTGPTSQTASPRPPMQPTAKSHESPLAITMLSNRSGNWKDYQKRQQAKVANQT